MNDDGEERCTKHHHKMQMVLCRHAHSESGLRSGGEMEWESYHLVKTAGVHRRSWGEMQVRGWASGLEMKVEGQMMK